MAAVEHEHVLFGGKRGWSAQDWTASDDRVRGGASQSRLQIDGQVATFCGHLDINTLGGAGFASQRTTGDDRHWNLSQHDGLLLTVDASKSDSKVYTLIVKDETLPKDPDSGREQATISWEYDFQVRRGHQHESVTQGTTMFIPWKAFNPTYRGKERKAGHALKTSDLRRISIMMRSHFGAQQGDFKLHVCQISAGHVPKQPDSQVQIADTHDESSNEDDELASKERPQSQQSKGMLLRLFPCCGRL